jgi:hypothetical protein
MIEDFRERAQRCFQRFLLGEISVDELQRAIEEFEAGSVVELCDVLSFLGDGCWGVTVDYRHVARRLAAYLEGELDHAELTRWIDQLREIIAAPHYRTSRHFSPRLKSTLGTISTALAIFRGPAGATSSAGDIPAAARACLSDLAARLESGRSAPCRIFIPYVLRHAGTLRLRVLESPLARATERACQWFDVGMLPHSGSRSMHRGRHEPASAPPRAAAGRGVEDEIRLIPFSLFTRQFFHRELPRIMAELDEESWTGKDQFHYHPENNVAIPLCERRPSLRAVYPAFDYFIDEQGLAEIVIDAESLQLPEILFATRVFCLHNGIRQVTLNGNAVALHG